MLFRKFGNFLHGLFGLRVYGDSLLSPVVRTTMWFFCAILLLQALVDGWAWNRTFSYALPGQEIIPLVLGCAFAGLILIVDRFLIITDTSGARRQMVPLAGRAALILLFAVVTAVPVELSVFQNEIDRRIEQKEKAKIDEIRQKAIELEERKFDERMADASNNGTHLVTADQAKLDRDISTFQADAAKRHEELAALLKAKSDEVAKEAAGAGLSHHLGRGPAYLALQAQEADLRKALNDHDTATQVHLDELRKQRDTVIDGGRAKGEGDVSKLRADKDAKLDEVRTMDPDALAQKYQGDWRISRGFLTRFWELEAMRDEDSTVNLVVWGCRLLMILFGLSILLLKLMAPLEFRRYYSVGAQAAEGNEDVRKVVLGMGHTALTRNLGFTPEVTGLQTAWQTACFKFMEAVLSARKGVSGTIVPDSNGLYPARHILDREMRSAWAEKVFPSFHDLQMIQLQMEQKAVPIPTWPATSPISDPRGVLEPWRWSDDDLNELGWVSPEEAVLHAREGILTLATFYRELREIINGEFTSTLVVLVHSNPNAVRTFFTQRMFQFYQDRIIPHINQIEEIEELIRRGGLAVPVSPADLPNRNALASVWQIDERDLRKYGWVGQRLIIRERTAPVARPRPPRRPIPASLPEFNETRQPTNTRRPGDTLEMPAIPPVVADPPTDTVPSTTDADELDEIHIEEETDADRRAANAAAESLYDEEERKFFETYPEAATDPDGKTHPRNGKVRSAAPKRTGPPPIPTT